MRNEGTYKSSKTQYATKRRLTAAQALRMRKRIISMAKTSGMGSSFTKSMLKMMEDYVNGQSGTGGGPVAKDWGGTGGGPTA